MAETKKLNESTFAKLVKEFHAVGELIRARQNEKQAIIDAFDLEKKRYSAGKLAKKALESSVKKTNKEFLRLDKEIRKQIARVNSIGTTAKKLASQQAPKVFRAKTTGISLLAKRVKKKVVKKIRKKVTKKANNSKGTKKKVVRRVKKKVVRKK